ncbi:glycoside hydrolase family 16 protein [Dysgonomonas macrotermitis]|uniref:Glycosyl hydrolases family 16 n=1 Tax=Dysgonomonas macrotermitis TaxID=1346286 RepID=A0A1M4YED2_9BACT|nr:glycoside hydrolase family 16 protein [Dysgonomonas macrotermitis]SHF04137.1 Glycosyl hydrolases family 16 [Dysgonomonas macrotermitis]
MKKKIYILPAILLLMCSCSSDEHDSTLPTPWPKDPNEQEEEDKSGIDKTYTIGQQLENNDIQLIWADEFDADELNLDFWTYERGYVRNSEVQYYTVGRKENCKLEGGMLVITGQKEEGSFEDQDGTHNDLYTSASIITNTKKSWKYGRFEIRAKVPGGTTGIWPAFWAKGDSQNSGASWPSCGEIDIMEYAVKSPYEMINNVIWGESSSASKSSTRKVPSDTKYSDDFHIYSLNWSPTQITFAIDNKVTHVVEMADISPNPFHQPFSILLNLALGTPSDNSLGGKFDEANLPVQFLVEYVRIYQTSAE